MQKKNDRNKLIGIFVAAGIVTVLLVLLLVSIFERKMEAKDSYIKLANVTEETTDPEPWGMNFPLQYDSYKKTAEPTKTNFGGGEALPAEKAEKDPWLTRLFAGYAFSLDYRDRRGHAFMLLDQEKTRRVTEKPQPGACLHCHASIIPAYRAVGLKLGAKPEEAVMKGFEEVSSMKYKDAHDLMDASGKKMVQHPVSCVDCHDSKTMALRVTRPGFINGIKAYKEHEGVKDYDVNKMATRQEMRTFVCAQCHVEYYFKGDRKTVTYPWANGLKVEEIEKYYDDAKFTDWKHAETGAPVLKAQHPEFEMWSQGVHARSGVSCADCHMPYQRVGAMKTSDHWVRSPLTNVNRACQQCHHYPEAEIQNRVSLIQNRTYNLMQRASKALISYLDVIKIIRSPVDAKTEADVAAKLKKENPNPEEYKKKMKEAKDAAWAKIVGTDKDLQTAWDMQKKGQWRLDYVAAENSMGFHAPQEAAKILAEATDYLRQAEIAARASAARRIKK